MWAFASSELRIMLHYLIAPAFPKSKVPFGRCYFVKIIIDKVSSSL